jgi:hypothetical protein
MNAGIILFIFEIIRGLSEYSTSFSDEIPEKEYKVQDMPERVFSHFKKVKKRMLPDNTRFTVVS